MIDALKNKGIESSQLEELHLIDKKHNVRFEYKFTVPDRFTTNNIIQFVKADKALFR